MKKTVLIVIDGLGLRQEQQGNGFALNFIHLLLISYLKNTLIQLFKHQENMLVYQKVKWVIQKLVI
ncbi:hypothetical protein NW072_03840 [Mycoplasmopsis felis]|nr:hypothetical protein [Mycoplasmopsis felis]UWV79195.1 hypothetical protein NW072_03840 [Mycoplasmopsis felis]